MNRKPLSKKLLLLATAIAPIAWVDFTLGVLPSWLTFSRAGNARQYDSTGKLTYAPNNLLTYSNTFSNAAWVATTMGVASGVSDPLGGTAAFTLTASAGNGTLVQTASTVAANIINAVWIKRRTGSGTVQVSDPTGAYTTVTVTGSWTQVYVAYAGTSGTGKFGIKIVTNGDAVDVYAATQSAVTYETTPRSQDQVITTSAAYYGPRFDYDPSGPTAKGLLIEEARTNLVTYSQDFSNAAWTKSGTITSTGTNPAGVTGQLFTPSADSSQKLIFQTVTVTTATSYAVSYFVQPNGYSKVALRESAATGAYAAFNLTGSGSVLDSGSGGTGSVVKLANGWYRITMVSTSSGTSFRPDLWVLDPIYTTGSVIGSWTADGTSGVYVFGAQLEAGACSTSYIPTTSASATRAAETVSFTGTALATFQGAAFSAVIELNGSQGVINGTTSILTTNASQYPIYVSTNMAGSTYNGSVALQTTIGGSGTFTGTIPMRIVIAGDAGGRSFVANNGTLTTDANKMFPTAVTNAYLGSLVGSYQFNGWFGKVALYNTRLPDVTLKSKSVAGAPFW